MSLLSYRDGRFFSGYHPDYAGYGAGSSCGQHLVAKGKNCCVPANIAWKGKEICCGGKVLPATAIKQPNGKYSIKCTKGGSTDPGSNGGGGSGDAKITAVSGSTVTLSKSLDSSCSGGTPEMRRHATGLREFVGDVQSHSGNTYNLSFGSLPSGSKPKVGETVYIWCAHEDGGGGGIGDAFSSIGDSLGLSDGIPSWAIIGGIGLAAYLLFFNKPTVVAK